MRINDRGPVVPDRIVDVSYSAAKVLGFVIPRCTAGAHRYRPPVSDGYASSSQLSRSQLVQDQLDSRVMDPRERLIVALDVSSLPPGRLSLPWASRPPFIKWGCSSTPPKAPPWCGT